jgi:hypothetical protein
MSSQIHHHSGDSGDWLEDVAVLLMLFSAAAVIVVIVVLLIAL